MAKNKKKVVDLKPTTITQEELKQIQELINLVTKGETQIGTLETKKHSLLHQIFAVQEKIATLQKQFQDTYGNVDINITDGTINYIEDEQANKKN